MAADLGLLLVLSGLARAGWNRALAPSAVEMAVEELSGLGQGNENPKKQDTES